MRHIKINLNKIEKKQIEIIANYFKSGKIVAYPTDTIYGLGCIACDENAINKIYNIKKRDKNKTMLVLMKSYCMLKKYCFVSLKQDKFLRTVWTKKPNLKPTSVVLKSRGLLPGELSRTDNSIAVRMPLQNDFLMQVLKKVNIPIVSTSLNISGQTVLASIVNIEKYFGENKIDLAVDAGEIYNKKSSRLIDIMDIDNIKIIRK